MIEGQYLWKKNPENKIKFSGRNSNQKSDAILYQYKGKK